MIRNSLKLRLRSKSGKYTISQEIFVLTIIIDNQPLTQCTLNSESTTYSITDFLQQKINLNQSIFFGYRYQLKCQDPDKRIFRWLEPDKPIKKQLDKYACKNRQVNIAILFPVVNPFAITDQISRSLYFFLIKTDVVNGKFSLESDVYLNLAAYSLLIEFGEYDPTVSLDFLRGLKLLPKQFLQMGVLVDDHLLRILTIYERLSEMSSSRAALLYMVDVIDCAGYGEELFTCRDEDSVEAFVGYSLNGFIVKNHADNILIPFLDIKHITCHKRYGVFKLKKGKILKFLFEDVEKARYTTTVFNWIIKYFLTNAILQKNIPMEMKNLCEPITSFAIYRKPSIIHSPFNSSQNSQGYLTSESHSPKSISPQRLSMAFRNEHFYTKSTSQSQSLNSVSMLKSNSTVSNNNHQLHQMSLTTSPHQQAHQHVLQHQSSVPLPNTVHFESSYLNENRAKTLGSSPEIHLIRGQNHHSHDSENSHLKFIKRSSDRGRRANQMAEAAKQKSQNSSSFHLNSTESYDDENNHHESFDRFRSTPNLTLNKPFKTHAPYICPPQYNVPTKYLPSTSCFYNLISEALTTQSDYIDSGRDSFCTDFPEKPMISKSFSIDEVEEEEENADSEANPMSDIFRSTYSCNEPNDVTNEGFNESQNNNQQRKRPQLVRQDSCDLKSSHGDEDLELPSYPKEHPIHFTTNSYHLSESNSPIENMEGIMKCENNLCFGLDDTLSFLLKKLNNPAGLNKEFNEIPKKRVSAGTSTALNIQNISKNRSSYILPYEDTRVSIQPTTHNINGYINASHIKIPLGGNNVLEYLITQNPLQNTINDFYQMVWEKNIHVIAMIQKQSNTSTIPTYWPSNINEKLKLASFSVRLRSSNKSTSVLALKCLRSGRKRTIYHIKFTDIDDCCTPISSDSFLGFVDTVGSIRRHVFNTIMDNERILEQTTQFSSKTSKKDSRSRSVSRANLLDVTNRLRSFSSEPNPKIPSTLARSIEWNRMALVSGVNSDTISTSTHSSQRSSQHSYTDSGKGSHTGGEDEKSRSSNPLVKGKTNDPELLVHCVDGSNESGVFILTDIILKCLENNIPFEINKILHIMRQQRMNLIQSNVGYHFVYSTVSHHLQKHRLI